MTAGSYIYCHPKDPEGEEIFSGQVKLQNGVTLPTWATWNNGTEDVTVHVIGTTTYVATTLDKPEALAFADGVLSGCGMLADVLANVSEGETVELLRDVENVQNLTIGAAITLDGNSHTLSVYMGEEAPVLDNGKWYLIQNFASGVTLKNLYISGGAAETGVWNNDDLCYENLCLIRQTSQTLTMENCTISRFRMKNTTTGNAMLNYYCSSGTLNLIDCEISDNMIQIPYASTETDLHKKTVTLLLFPTGGTLNLSGKIVIKNNWSITNDHLKAMPLNSIAFGSSISYFKVGQLTNGSHIELQNAVSYTPLLDEQGVPYNNDGYFYYHNPKNMCDPAESLMGDNGNILYGGDLAYDGTALTLIKKPTLVLKERQAGIDRDKVSFVLVTQSNIGYFDDTLYDVVAKLGGTEVARVQLGRQTLKGHELSFPVDVGMAELADKIVFELQDSETKAVISTSASDSVKAYATTVINMTNEDIVTNGYAPSAEKATSMKAALASLLQYGAMVQKHFNYNLDALAMTADEESAWTTAGYIQAVGDGLRGGTQNEAVMSGSVSGVNIVGATLTMENQMSLRLYFTADSLDGITFTVGGQTAEVQTGNGMYYLEALHIGTASLASPVIITITKGSETLTYTVSPMSYVYAVFAKNNAAVTDSLRNACEALYYYFAAAGDYFGNFETNIGFETDVVMSASTTEDPVNTYGLPYGIA